MVGKAPGTEFGLGWAWGMGFRRGTESRALQIPHASELTATASLQHALQAGGGHGTEPDANLLERLSAFG